jgi:hypothetical protein
MKPSRRRVELSGSVQHHLNMYALVASAAGVGALALVLPSEAKIVYTPTHVTLQNSQPFALDLNHDGKVDFYLVQRRQFDGRTHSASNLSVCHAPSAGTQAVCLGTMQSSNAPNALNAVATVAATSYLQAAALPAGAKIQRGRRFRNKKPILMGAGEFYHSSQEKSSTLWIAPWVNGGKGIKNHYLGLKFKVKGKFHFGWARLTVTTSRNSFTAKLTGYAYETIPGDAIVAGQTKGSDDGIQESNAFPRVPASQRATLGMLAIGAPALSIWRREDSVAAPLQGN